MVNFFEGLGIIIVKSETRKNNFKNFSEKWLTFSNNRYYSYEKRKKGDENKKINLQN
jgi:hypothetical protein